MFFSYQVNGQLVEWRFYQTAWKLDQQLLAGKRHMPKITQNHVNPTSNDKMKVSYATQVSLRPQKLTVMN